MNYISNYKSNFLPLSFSLYLTNSTRKQEAFIAAKGGKVGEALPPWVGVSSGGETQGGDHELVYGKDCYCNNNNYGNACDCNDITTSVVIVTIIITAMLVIVMTLPRVL